MTEVLQERSGVQVLMCDPAGPKVVTAEGAPAFLRTETVAVPAGRLDEQFFSLGTRFAGEIMQKGDISRHLETSSALRAMVHEPDSANRTWFPPDIEALDARPKAMS